MSTEVKVVNIREFLKVTVQGVVDLKTSKDALFRLSSVSPTSPDIDFLIDVRESPVTLSLAEITELVSEFNTMRVGAGRRTAVLTEKPHFGNAEFFAILARGRGNEVQAFTSLEEALDWLAT